MNHLPPPSLPFPYPVLSYHNVVLTHHNGAQPPEARDLGYITGGGWLIPAHPYLFQQQGMVWSCCFSSLKCPGLAILGGTWCDGACLWCPAGSWLISMVMSGPGLLPRVMFGLCCSHALCSCP